MPDVVQRTRVPGQIGLRCALRAEFGAKDVLNTANNRLQELMQLLYLLSRDPAVPNDARFHVTLAQSEIALLVRIMRNAEEAHDNATKLPAAGSAVVPNNL